MSELMQEGVELMLLGMAVVFVLLTVMVGAMNLMSKLAAVLEPPRPAAEAAGGTGRAGNAHELVAVVSAAIQANRRGR